MRVGDGNARAASAGWAARRRASGRGGSARTPAYKEDRMVPTSVARSREVRSPGAERPKEQLKSRTSRATRCFVRWRARNGAAAQQLMPTSGTAARPRRALIRPRRQKPQRALGDARRLPHEVHALERLRELALESRVGAWSEAIFCAPIHEPSKGLLGAEIILKLAGSGRDLRVTVRDVAANLGLIPRRGEF